MSWKETILDWFEIFGPASLFFLSFTEAIIQQIAVVSDRNKELGGSPHENAEEFAKGRGLAVRQRFTKYFNDGRWNGDFTVDDGLSISAPPADETEEGTGEVNEGV